MTTVQRGADGPTTLTYEPATDLRLSTTTGDDTRVVNTLDEYGRVSGEEVFTGAEVVSQRFRGFQNDGSVAWVYAPRAVLPEPPRRPSDPACPRNPGAVCFTTVAGLPASVSRDGRETRYAYDADGQLRSIEHGGLRRTYTRDLAGRLTSLDSALNVTTAFQYDSRDRVTRVVHPGGRATQYEYRPDGRLRFRRFERILGGAVPDDGLASVEHRYDPLGRMVTIHEDHVAVDEPDVVTTLDYDGATYDAAGRLTGALSRDGARSATFGWSYDQNSGRASTFSATSGGSILRGTFDRYDGAGRPSQVTLGPIRATHTYRAGRLIGTTFEDTIRASVVARFSESGHDLRGHARRIEQHADGRSRVDETTYDEQGQLTDFDSEDETGTALDSHLDFDGNSHRTRTRTGRRDNGTPLRDDQLTTGADGSLSQVTLRVEGRDVALASEIDGRLTRLDNLDLSRDRQGRPRRDTYGHDGNRVASTDGSRISRHGDALSTVRSADNYTWLYAPPLPGFGLAFRVDRWSIDLTNAQRSPLVTTDETGRVTRTATYDPFGDADEVLTPGEGPPPTTFGGDLRVSTGVGGQTLLDAGQRLYHPRWGRFLEPDPVDADPADPRTLASFSYAFNDPVAYVDPDGRCGVPGALIGAGVGFVFGAIGAMINGDPPEEIAAKAAVGGLSGLVVGATCGASLAVTVGVGAAAGAATEVASAAIDGERDPTKLMLAGLRGGIGGAVGGLGAVKIAAKVLGPAASILANFAVSAGADLVGQSAAAAVGGEPVSLKSALFAGVLGAAARGAELGAPQLARAAAGGAPKMMAKVRAGVLAVGLTLGRTGGARHPGSHAWAAGAGGNGGAHRGSPSDATGDPSAVGPLCGGVSGAGCVASKGGGKFVPNPGGRLGDQLTRQRTADLVRELESQGHRVEREVLFQTPGGFKGRRFADVVATDASTGVRSIFQIGRTTKGGLPVMRERKAILDIVNSPDTRSTDRLFFIDKITGSQL